jgi:hypothetical protein
VRCCRSSASCQAVDVLDEGQFDVEAGVHLDRLDGAKLGDEDVFAFVDGVERAGNDHEDGDDDDDQAGAADVAQGDLDLAVRPVAALLNGLEPLVLKVLSGMSVHPVVLLVPLVLVPEKGSRGRSLLVPVPSSM